MTGPRAVRKCFWSCLGTASQPKKGEIARIVCHLGRKVLRMLWLAMPAGQTRPSDLACLRAMQAARPVCVGCGSPTAARAHAAPLSIRRLANVCLVPLAPHGQSADRNGLSLPPISLLYFSFWLTSRRKLPGRAGAQPAGPPRGKNRFRSSWVASCCRCSGSRWRTVGSVHPHARGLPAVRLRAKSQLTASQGGRGATTPEPVAAHPHPR